MNTRRRFPILGAAIIAISFFLGGLFWIRYANQQQKTEIARLEQLAERLRSETVPLKFMIVKKSESDITVRLRLYDLAGGEISIVERTLPGRSIFIDMLLVPLVSPGGGMASQRSYLAFPYRIFTDTTSPASGTLLFDAYDRKGFPRVLDGVQWTSAERAAIVSAFGAVRAEAAKGEPASAAAGAFGSAVHESLDFSRFDEGVVYKVVCRLRGGVEILED